MGGVFTHRAGVFNPAGGGALAYFTAESVGPTNIPESAAASVFYATASLDALADEQIANATYLGIWSTDTVTNNGNIQPNRLRKDGTTTVSSQFFPLKDVTPFDRHTMGGLFFHAAGASPSDVNYTIDHAKDDTGTATAYNSRVSLLEIGLNDVTSEDLAGPGSLTNTTMSTVDSLTLPGGPYDWLVMISFEVQQTNAVFKFELTDGTTTTNEVGPSTKGALNSTIPVQAALFLDGVTGATVNLNMRTVSASFAYVATNIRMVALRLDRFAGKTGSGLVADNAGTDTSYTAAHSQTFTPSAQDHLIVAAGIFAANSTSISISGRFMDDATEVNQFTREATTSGDAYPFFSHRIAALPASSRTQSLDRLSETASVTATVRDDAVIIAIDLSGL